MKIICTKCERILQPELKHVLKQFSQLRLILANQLSIGGIYMSKCSNHRKRFKKMNVMFQLYFQNCR